MKTEHEAEQQFMEWGLDELINLFDEWTNKFEDEAENVFDGQLPTDPEDDREFEKWLDQVNDLEMRVVKKFVGRLRKIGYLRFNAFEEVVREF